MTTRKTLRWTALTVTIGALGVAQASLRATDRQTVQAPRFEVDPVWPKPMPNHWILGSVIGVGVDSRDHVFIIHRGDSTLNQRTEAGLHPFLVRVLGHQEPNRLLRDRLRPFETPPAPVRTVLPGFMVCFA